MKNWWINNSWRFWAWQWAFGDEDSSFNAWQEYRHMRNPEDGRSLADLIIEEYKADVRRDVLGNPVIQVVWWVRQIGRNLRPFFTKIEPPI